MTDVELAMLENHLDYIENLRRSGYDEDEIDYILTQEDSIDE